MQHLLIDPAGVISDATLAFVVPDNREAIEAAVEALIARLDAVDGDPDLEHDPFNEGEPTFHESSLAHVNGRYGASLMVDDEEDDPSGTYPDEDEPIGCPAQCAPSGPGCEISDPGGTELGIGA